MSYSDTIHKTKTTVHPLIINPHYCDSILQEINSSNNDTANIISYKALVKFYKEKFDIGNASPYLEKIISIAEALNKKSNNINLILAYAYLERAHLLINTNINNSILDNLKALKIYDQLGNNEKKNAAYVNMANNYYILLEYNQALKYYFLAYSAYSKLIAQHPNDIKNKIKFADINLNISQVYKDLKQYDVGLQHLNKSFEIYKNQNDTFKLAYTFIVYSKFYIDEKKYLLANDYAEKAYKIAELKNFNAIRTQSYIALSKIQFYLKNYDKALHFTNLLIEVALKQNDFLNLSKAYYTRYEIYKNLKKIDLALNNFEKSKQYNDSVFKAELILNSKNLEEKYQFEKKEKEINILKSKNEIKNIEIANTNKLKNRYLIILILSIISVILILIILLFNIRSKKRQKIMDAEIMEFRINIAKYQSQMNPHFIFNAISGIQNFILLEKRDDAMQQTVSFSKLMRQMLNNSDKEFINLQTEINFINEYIFIERRRFNKQLLFLFNVAPTLDIENTLILPMLLQPFVIIVGFLISKFFYH